MELIRLHYCSMVFNDFTVGLNLKEHLQCLQLAYVDEAPVHIAGFTFFTEFRRGVSSFIDEEQRGSSLSAVIRENMTECQKMSVGGKHCTCQKIQKEINTVSAAVDKTNHEELHMKKIFFVSYPLCNRKPKMRACQYWQRNLTYVTHNFDEISYCFLKSQHLRKVKYII